MIFRQLYDLESSTYSYLLADPDTREAVLVDPVIERIERDLALLSDLGLTLTHVLDTHVHADHVTAAGALRERTGARTTLSERSGAGCADVYVKEGDLVHFGRYALEVRETPGHTHGCVTYVLSDHSMAFTGDALLIRGSGRTDFQQGDARTLYRSVHEKIFSLPDGCLLYPAHDYQGRTVTTVAEERTHNPRLGGGRSEDDFVALMGSLNLPYPKKIDLALPANLQCGMPHGQPADAGEPERDWAPIEVSAAGIPEVTPAWVAANTGAARLVDVRETPELTSELGHIPGIAHVPLATVEKVAEKLPRERPIVLVCRSGGRSGKAALQLRAMGFTRVASMRGGMIEWNAENLPIARGHAPTDTLQG